ncbi:MAG: SMC-Scp complex subunit ScpB [Candidatus Bathyarchaeia archaeon]
MIDGGAKGASAAEMNERLAIIEAALYVAGRPLDLPTLCSVSGIASKRLVYELAKKLAREYDRRGGALELLELPERRFVLQVKAQYVPRVRRLSIKPLLGEGPLKTLSFIALNQPVAQVKAAAVRGGQVYEHIRLLEKMGLVTARPAGRTKLLNTTDAFADYFRLSRDLKTMKRQFKTMVETQAEETPQESAPHRD